MNSKGHPPFPFPLLRFWILRILPIWFSIAAIIFLFQIAICGIVHDNESVKTFLQFIDMLPSFIKTALGGEALQVGNVSGLIAIGYNHPLVLTLYMLFAVGVPTGLLAGEVQKGTMELILCRYVTKKHVYISAGLITITGMFALVMVMFSGTVVGVNIYEFGQDVPLYSFFKASINGGILASVAGGIALLAAACFQRNTAVWITVTYLIVNYFVSIIAEWWPRMKWLYPSSIFYYVNGEKIFREAGWPLGDMAVLLSILVASTLLGGIIWSRRDLPL
ncbi:MAG: hypothetical protein JW837_14345 [Sedimentisphaerales bacterium]|nr:hypothetical protein [Sedimentisphaerales bacterium]